MNNTELHEVLLQTNLFKTIAESSNSVLKKRGIDSGFIVTDLIEGRVTEILIGFQKSFPLTPPSFFINDYGNHEFIPHAEEDGKICYSHEDNLFLDVVRPVDVISEIYEKVKRIISQGLRKDNWSDFTEEFEAYWRRISGAETIYSNIVISSTPCLIKVGTKGNAKIIVVSENNESLRSIERLITHDASGITYQNGLYIPLIPNKQLIPPRYNTPLDINYLKSLLEENTSPHFQQQIKKMLHKCIASGVIIFSYVSPKGNNIFFGIRFPKSFDVHPLSNKNYTGKIFPLSMQRLDKEYLYKRGGSGENTSDKNGLIIGCGSVGGFITEELVRNGFMNLTVVDSDDLKVENCYRHLLGFSKIGVNKAIAIKEKIEQYFPHSKITSHDDTIENLILKRKIEFGAFDFIVIATGNVTINCYLNDLLYKKYHDKPVFYSWNEPYGIGGHCLVTNISGKGCYECLYSDDNAFNSASLADKNQPKSFLKAISGCGSIYTPYGAIASQRTCLLTVSKIIDTLKGAVRKNSIYTWKGNSEIFINEGYSLSPRYFMTDEELFARQNEFVHSECPICKNLPN